MNAWKQTREALALVGVGLGFITTACAQQADPNEVGKQMAIMLQNSHFARLTFNEELSKRFFEDYLRDLDYSRVYFTQADVDRLRQQYGDKLHLMLMQGECQRAAADIYALYQERVKTRVAQAMTWLNENNFDFSKEEFIKRSRKDAPWPKDEAEATALWKQQVKEAVLAETLRRETIARMAKEQGKENPLAKEAEPTSKLKLRYERFLHSVTDVDDEDIASSFLSAVSRAYDPHTDYMNPKEMDRFKSGMKNELVGIGALLQAEEDGATKIKGIVVNGPADKQGELKLDDRVVAVDPDNSGNMVDIMFMKIDKVVDLIRGKEGSPVRLKVEPASGTPGETKLVVITRAMVEMKDEQASADIIDMKQPDGSTRRLGWLTIPSFYADFDEGKTRVSVDVEKLLNRMIHEKVEGVVVDLRNNGGGSLEEVRRMTGFFIERGPVVQVKNTLGQVQTKESSNRQPVYQGPLVVLIDKASASASEILAGALQDFNRAVIVGDSSTFGKGTVQQPMDIGNMLPFFAKERDRAGYLKVTIQKFYRPSGSSTQLQGVVSDVVLPNLTEAVEIGEAFLDHPLAHDRIRQAPDFRPLDQANLFLPRLKEDSAKRLKESKDFAYVTEDIQRAKERLAKNEVSLRKDDRMKEIMEADAREKQRNTERRERFAKEEKTDREDLRFFKLRLEDVIADKPLVAYDPSKEQQEFMRRSKEETEDLDQTPHWPSGMDPQKRESLAILKDLVQATDAARMAGMLRKQPAAQ